MIAATAAVHGLIVVTRNVRDFDGLALPPFANLMRSSVSQRLRPTDPRQIDFTSPPSMRSVEPVIQRAPGETRKAISSAISSGSP